MIVRLTKSPKPTESGEACAALTIIRMKEGENQNDNKNEVSRSRFSICAATSDTRCPTSRFTLPPKFQGFHRSCSSAAEARILTPANNCGRANRAPAIESGPLPRKLPHPSPDEVVLERDKRVPHRYSFYTLEIRRATVPHLTKEALC